MKRVELFYYKNENEAAVETENKTGFEVLRCRTWSGQQFGLIFDVWPLQSESIAKKIKQIYFYASSKRDQQKWLNAVDSSTRKYSQDELENQPKYTSNNSEASSKYSTYSNEFGPTFSTMNSIDTAMANNEIFRPESNYETNEIYGITQDNNSKSIFIVNLLSVSDKSKICGISEELSSNFSHYGGQVFASGAFNIVSKSKIQNFDPSESIFFNKVAMVTRWESMNEFESWYENSILTKLLEPQNAVIYTAECFALPSFSLPSVMGSLLIFTMRKPMMDDRYTMMSDEESIAYYVDLLQNQVIDIIARYYTKEEFQNLKGIASKVPYVIGAGTPADFCARSSNTDKVSILCYVPSAKACHLWWENEGEKLFGKSNKSPNPGHMKSSLNGNDNRVVMVDCIGERNSITDFVGGALPWWRNDHWPVRQIIRKPLKCRMCSVKFSIKKKHFYCRSCFQSFCRKCSRHKAFFTADGRVKLLESSEVFSAKVRKAFRASLDAESTYRRMCDKCFVRMISHQEKHGLAKLKRKHEKNNSLAFLFPSGKSEIEEMNAITTKAIEGSEEIEEIGQDSISSSHQLSLTEIDDSDMELLSPWQEIQQATSYQKYFKMISFKVPIQGVLQKMQIDGIDTNIINCFAENIRMENSNESTNTFADQFDSNPPSTKFFHDTQTSNEGEIDAVSSLRKLHWDVLLSNKLGKSIFETRDSMDELVPTSRLSASDMVHLRHLFKIKPTSKHVESNHTASPVMKRNVKVLLSNERSRQVGIGLAKFKQTGTDNFQHIAQAINAFSDLLTLDKLIILRNILPTKCELSYICSYKHEENEVLDRPELFMLAMAEVEDVSEKVEAMIYVLEFDASVQDIISAITNIQLACDEVVSSKKLNRLMHMILTVGNVLNRGTSKGGAKGFSLNSLSVLSETRAVRCQRSVLDYIISLLINKGEGNVLTFLDDMPHLKTASNLSVSVLNNCFLHLSFGFEKTLKTLNDQKNKQWVNFEPKIRIDKGDELLNINDKNASEIRSPISTDGKVVSKNISNDNRAHLLNMICNAGGVEGLRAKKDKKVMDNGINQNNEEHEHYHQSTFISQLERFHVDAKSKMASLSTKLDIMKNSCASVSRYFAMEKDLNTSIKKILDTQNIFMILVKFATDIKQSLQSSKENINQSKSLLDFSESVIKVEVGFTVVTRFGIGVIHAIRSNYLNPPAFSCVVPSSDHLSPKTDAVPNYDKSTHRFKRVRPDDKPHEQLFYTIQLSFGRLYAPARDIGVPFSVIECDQYGKGIVLELISRGNEAVVKFKSGMITVSTASMRMAVFNGEDDSNFLSCHPYKFNEYVLTRYGGGRIMGFVEDLNKYSVELTSTSHGKLYTDKALVTIGLNEIAKEGDLVETAMGVGRLVYRTLRHKKKGVYVIDFGDFSTANYSRTELPIEMISLMKSNAAEFSSKTKIMDKETISIKPIDEEPVMSGSMFLPALSTAGFGLLKTWVETPFGEGECQDIADDKCLVKHINFDCRSSFLRDTEVKICDIKPHPIPDRPEFVRLHILNMIVNEIELKIAKLYGKFRIVVTDINTSENSLLTKSTQISEYIRLDDEIANMLSQLEKVQLLRTTPILEVELHEDQNKSVDGAPAQKENLKLAKSPKKHIGSDFWKICKWYEQMLLGDTNIE